MTALVGCAQTNSIEKTLKSYMNTGLVCKVWFDKEPVMVIKSFPYEFYSAQWKNSQRPVYEVAQAIAIVPINDDLFTAHFLAKATEVENKLTQMDGRIVKVPTVNEHQYKLNTQNSSLYKVGFVYSEEFEIYFNNKKSTTVVNKISCKK